MADFFENFDFYEGLKTSLEQAAAFDRGEANNCRVRIYTIPEPSYAGKDIARIRQTHTLSQHAFAMALGVSPRTVEAWEVGRKTPSGAAQHLLYLIDNNPQLITQLYSIKSAD
jgi:putative transcriptional regulator